MKKSPVAILLTVISIIIVIAIAEVTFRFLLPETFLLDWHSPNYWKAKLVEKIDRDKHSELNHSNKVEKNVVYDPDLGWRMAPFYENDGVVHNSRGFRGSKEYNNQPIKDRVFAIGDSYTYGLGVSDEYAFSSLLDDLPGVEVINAGVNGYGLDQSYLMWELEGKKLNPSIIIVGYFIDDFYRNSYSVRGMPKPYFLYDEETQRYNLEGIPAPDIKTVSEQGDLEVDQWLKIFRFIPWIKKGIQNRWGSEKVPNIEALMNNARLNDYILRKLNQSVEQTGAKLVVVLIGSHPKCYEPSPEVKWVEDAIVKSSQHNGIELINLSEEMRKSTYYSSFYALHCHFSESGHRFAAEKIAESLGLTIKQSRN